MIGPVNGADEREVIWECKIGGAVPGQMPNGWDAPMRRAVQEAFRTLTGVEAKFAFSGGGHLTETERAVVEKRQPRASLGAAQVPAPATTHVEARECSNCGHAGINDSSATLANCCYCGWIGDSPADDVCPDCKRPAAMSSACPKCGDRYVLVAEADIPSAGAAQVPSGWKPIETAPKKGLVDILINSNRYADCHYDGICKEYRHLTACGKLISLLNATHWMLPPALPAALSQQGDAK